MSLEVLDPGWASWVVDFGRPASRSLGVPVGGAADRGALALGNALVGNAPDAPALEISLSGPRLRATADVAAVLFGAPFTMTSPDPGLRPGRTFTLRGGEELHVGSCAEGVRAYLCVRGGFQAEAVLGSRSALRPVRRGDPLACPIATIAHHFAPDIMPKFERRVTLRVLPGLQASWFRPEDFERQEFEVGSASNRMGLRLQAEPLALPDRELVSEPVAPGAVQVTRDGQCIILGIDGQTIGGYPKIAQVIRADLDRLGQLRPGDRARFGTVTQAAAVTLYRQQQEALRNRVLRLRASLG